MGHFLPRRKTPKGARLPRDAPFSSRGVDVVRPNGAVIVIAGFARFAQGLVAASKLTV